MSDLGFCLYLEKRGSKINIFYAQLHSKKSLLCRLLCSLTPYIIIYYM
nr:MAG TPA: hypothetical protein [Caudoviricetes sp.]